MPASCIIAWKWSRQTFQAALFSIPDPEALADTIAKPVSGEEPAQPDESRSPYGLRIDDVIKLIQYVYSDANTPEIDKLGALVVLYTVYKEDVLLGP